MDKTETYIKMADCPEIQGQWNPGKGDFVCRPSSFNGYGDIIGKTPDSIVIAFIGEKEADSAKHMGKVAVYYSRNPINEWEDIDSFFHRNGTWVYWYDKKDYIWLPRQDQSQEMVGGHPRDLILAFHNWWQERNVRGETDWSASMEQLWLAFVMSEKYDKVWTGEEWK